VHSVAQSRNGGGFAEGESRIGRWCYWSALRHPMLVEATEFMELNTACEGKTGINDKKSVI
jgi:hypothetical protein